MGMNSKRHGHFLNSTLGDMQSYCNATRIDGFQKDNDRDMAIIMFNSTEGN